MITLFTTCRPFEGIHKRIQTLAIRSWALLEPRPEIILIGKEDGTREIAQELRCEYVRSVERNRWGTPLLSSLFWTALTCARNDILCYVNADIILLQDFMDVVDKVSQQLPKFLMLSPRWDLHIDVEHLDGDWQETMMELLITHATRHRATGQDCFIYTKNAYDPGSFPPLAIGRQAWDAWLIWRAMQGRVPVVDATNAITVVHQQHGKDREEKTEEKGLNIAMARERLGQGYIWDAKYRIGPPPEYELYRAPGSEKLWAKDVRWTWHSERYVSG